MEFIRNIFVISAEKRLRMLWRIVLQTLLMVVLVVLPLTALGLAVLFFAATARGIQPEDFGSLDPNALLQSMPLATALNSILILLGITLSIWVAARFIDRRPLADFGLKLDRAWWLDLIFGLFLGAFLMALIFLVELAVGWITVTGTFGSLHHSFGAAMLAQMLIFLSVGIYEELVSRAYHLTNFAQGFANWFNPVAGLLIGYVLSSSLFGIAHAANPNATLISTFNIILAGLFLGLGYLLTGRLAIPIGLHITWNFFQGNVFGFPVSGLESSVSFINIEQGGPALLTGANFGPEAGLIGIAAILLGSVLIALWALWREGSIKLHLPIAAPRTLAVESEPIHAE